MAILDKTIVYLDEAGDDIVAACAAISSAGFTKVALRYITTHNISGVSDAVCQTIRNALLKYNLKVACIASDVGYSTPFVLSKAERLCHLAAYFQTDLIRLGWGVRGVQVSEVDVLQWIHGVADVYRKYHVTPMYEITSDSQIYEAAVVSQMLAAEPYWKLLYDPAQLILKRNINPFMRYWSLLKNTVIGIDIHDYRIGYGFKPAGFGDAKLLQTLQDAATSKYSGWYLLEPGLGHGPGVTKQVAFQRGVDGFKLLLQELEKQRVR